ncbi:MAG: hypothetical protein ABEK04_05805 [Candidatus Nanohalobium sp.]
MEQVLDKFNYEELSEGLKDVYVEATSSYRLYQDWSEDEDVDWMEADKMLQRSWKFAKAVLKNSEHEYQVETEA